LILKIVAAVLSKSLSVVSSVVDSAVDLASSLILFWTWRLIKKRDKYRYPQGIFTRRTKKPIDVCLTYS
jgi:divalent metal cation (Fe/Co/Zn/Cd) transporter